MVAELAVISIEDPHVHMVRALAPIFLLGSLQVILGTIELKSQKFHKLINGSPIMIVDNGKLIEKNLRKHGFTIDDILIQLRQAEVSDLREVDYAILERSGALSVFKKGDNNFTLPLVLDGKIQENNLKVVNRTKNWLITELQKIGFNQVENILYCSYKNEKFHIQKKEHEA